MGPQIKQLPLRNRTVFSYTNLLKILFPCKKDITSGTRKKASRENVVPMDRTAHRILSSLRCVFYCCSALPSTDRSLLSRYISLRGHPDPEPDFADLYSTIDTNIACFQIPYIITNFSATEITVPSQESDSCKNDHSRSRQKA